MQQVRREQSTLLRLLDTSERVGTLLNPVKPVKQDDTNTRPSVQTTNRGRTAELRMRGVTMRAVSHTPRGIPSIRPQPPFAQERLPSVKEFLASYTGPG